MNSIQTHKFSIFRTLGSVALVVAILAITSSPLLALTTLNVTVNTDNNPGGFGDTGDLRNALNTMNQGLNTTADDYAIVFSAPMTIQLNGILPIINNSSNPVNITIGNSGSTPTVTIDGNSGAYPGFFIPSGTVTIQNIIFQNLTAKGGNGGDGISGGGGGMGAGGAIYAPQFFLNSSTPPSITLLNVSIKNCSAVGGNGGSFFSLSSTGNEGGGGGGGFSGNGGSILTIGSTGGAGGGGFGGNGGDVTLPFDSVNGGGGGGGGGLGSRATAVPLNNLGNGGSDVSQGQDGNGYGLTITAGAGGGGYSGGNNAGGGGGGGGTTESTLSGGGGGGSQGQNGLQPQGNIPPWDGVTKGAMTKKGTSPVTKKAGPLPKGASITPSGGNGGDGGGGGGGGIVVTTGSSNNVDGQAASGGYGGGGGGGAGTGSYDNAYTVQGGSGGVGGGGGGGGANESGETPAEGGSSSGGGGGAGGGPSNGPTASGGFDIGNLGGGSGGSGANLVGSGFGGGGGGGGSGLGGAIFVDSGVNFTIQAISGVPTTCNTSNNTTQAGVHGTGGTGASDGNDGSALGNSIFLRAGSSLTLIANDAGDLLTLGTGVAFDDDTTLGAGGTQIYVRGNGTVVYNGTTDYQGFLGIYNANFKVNGEIDATSVFVCRNVSISSQRGTLSGTGTLTGNVFVNSGAISPDAGQTLVVGSLALNSPFQPGNAIGSLVHIGIGPTNTFSNVSVTGSALLAGILEIDLDPNAQPGSYKILTSSGITGTFDSVTFTGPTPNYTVSYLPQGSPTYVQFDFIGFKTATPVIHPNGGPVIKKMSVQITDATPGATIYYTLDGSVPTTHSTQYTGYFVITGPTVVRAIAVKNGNQSDVATVSFGGAPTPTPTATPIATPTPTVTPTPTPSPTVTPTPTPTATPTPTPGGIVATPVIHPPSQSFSYKTISIQITDTAAGATIYYTLDGSTPTTSSTRYTGFFTISTTTTVKARAFMSGSSPSDVATSTFTKQ